MTLLKKFKLGNKKISVQYGGAKQWHSFFVDTENEAIERVRLLYGNVEIVQTVDNSHEITQADLLNIERKNEQNGFTEKKPSRYELLKAKKLAQKGN